jgi:hypothetical protein
LYRLSYHGSPVCGGLNSASGSIRHCGEAVAVYMSLELLSAGAAGMQAVALEFHSPSLSDFCIPPLLLSFSYHFTPSFIVSLSQFFLFTSFFLSFSADLLFSALKLKNKLKNPESNIVGV